MFLCSLIEELCTKEENYKTSCNFNFGHECIYAALNIIKSMYNFDLLKKCYLQNMIWIVFITWLQGYIKEFG